MLARRSHCPARYAPGGAILILTSILLGLAMPRQVSASSRPGTGHPLAVSVDRTNGQAHHPARAASPRAHRRGQIAAGGQGWLGMPTGPARAQALTTPNLLADGDFQGATGTEAGAGPLDPWTLCTCDGAAAATVSQDGGSAETGAASARIDVTRATPAMPWNVEFYQAGLGVAAGTTYTLSFWARAAAGRTLNAVIQQTGGDWAVRAGADVALDTSWRHYTLTFTPSVTESGLKLQFNLAQAVGSVWLGGVRFQQGDPNVWERDFTRGAVLVNGTDSPRTVDLGPGYRRIAGTQDPSVNNGAVATSVTLAPQDAIVLTKAF